MLQKTQKKNIIFLDIDGVLQPYGNQFRHDHDFDATLDMLRARYAPELVDKGDPADICAAYYDWDEAAMGRLAALCRHTGSYIVFHSAWIKYNSLERLKVFFAFYGMEGYVLDVCRNIPEKELQELRKPYNYYVDEKVFAIRDWLSAHEDEVLNYIVIDDLDLSWHFGIHYIGTSNYLTDVDAAAARCVLLGYQAEKSDDICMYTSGGCKAVYRILEVDGARGLFFRMRYYHDTAHEPNWQMRHLDYRLLFMSLQDNFCSEKTDKEHDRIDFISWVYKYPETSADRMEWKEILKGIYAYRKKNISAWPYRMSVWQSPAACSIAGDEGLARTGIAFMENNHG